MPPSPDDVKRFLLASEKPKVRLAISMLYATGMRLDELCHLRCADIIHSSMKIYIRHSKNHSDRYVPLTESIWQMILSQHRSVPESGYLPSRHALTILWISSGFNEKSYF